MATAEKSKRIFLGSNQLVMTRDEVEGAGFRYAGIMGQGVIGFSRNGLNVTWNCKTGICSLTNKERTPLKREEIPADLRQFIKARPLDFKAVNGL